MTLQCTVIVPTFRRPLLLRRCLRALAKQSISPTLSEVIVADDDADEHLHQIVKALSKRLPYKVFYVPVTSSQGPAGARNYGIKYARGNIIAFTDDDTIPDPNWLKNALIAFEDDNLIAAWGKVIVPVSDNPSDYERNVSRLESAGFVTANAFCRRQRLMEIGGFDASFTRAWLEDSDLYFRLVQNRRSNDERIDHIANSVVTQPIRTASWGCSVFHQTNNFFNPLLFKKHPQRYRETIQRYPPLLYYAVVFTLICACVGFLMRSSQAGYLFLCLWLLFTSIFVARRLRDTRRDFRHIWEMIVTSIAIPPLAVFWRLRGAFHWRVFFL